MSSSGQPGLARPSAESSTRPSEAGTPRNLLAFAQWDGTAFNGWQLQHEQRTVQGTLGAAIEAVIHQPVQLHASSRTDSGVHARAMPVTFETTSQIPTRGLWHGINSHLPNDLSLVSLREVPLGWRARHASVAKTYTYRIQLGARRPLTHHQVWWLRSPTLDLAAMRLAAAHLTGEHDFAAFRSVSCDAKTTRRCIHRFDIAEPNADELVVIDVTGNAFLRHMVRILIGNLVEVGLGRRAPDWVKGVLDGKDRTRGGPTAPASGLTLTEVHFEGYPRLGKSAPAERESSLPAEDSEDTEDG